MNIKNIIVFDINDIKYINYNDFENLDFEILNDNHFFNIELIFEDKSKEIIKINKEIEEKIISIFEKINK